MRQKTTKDWHSSTVLEIDDWIFGLMGALGLELVLWEMIGNSNFVHNKVRDEDSDVMGNTLGTLKNIFFQSDVM